MVVEHPNLRIRGEYLEMPGLRLTAVQAGRLWGMDVHLCEMFLADLVADGFLFRTVDGAYVRPDSPRAHGSR